MDVLEDALCYHIMKVGFHELEYKVDIFVILGFYCLVQLYDVYVIGLLQDFDFSVGPLSISGVLKGIEYFLQCVYLLCDSVLNFPYVPVRP